MPCSFCKPIYYITGIWIMMSFRRNGKKQYIICMYCLGLYAKDRMLIPSRGYHEMRKYATK